MSDKLPYRMITGPDDRAFCERISKALQEGYQLHGSPTMTFNGERVIVGQALVLAGYAARPAIQEELV